MFSVKHLIRKEKIIHCQDSRRPEVVDFEQDNGRPTTFDNFVNIVQSERSEEGFYFSGVLSGSNYWA